MLGVPGLHVSISQRQRDSGHVPGTGVADVTQGRSRGHAPKSFATTSDQYGILENVPLYICVQKLASECQVHRFNWISWL